MFSGEFCEISKNTFSYRTLPVGFWFLFFLSYEHSFNKKLEYSIDPDYSTKREENEKCFLKGTQELTYSIDLTLNEEKNEGKS